MPNTQLHRLIARKLSGEATPEELQQWQELASGNTALQSLYEMLSAYWQASAPAPGELKDAVADAHFEYILQSADDTDIITPEHPARHSIPWIRWLSVAAVITGVAVSIYYFLPVQGKNKSRTAQNDTSTSEVVAKPGVRSKLVLPDGSKVWLNSESKLTYNNSFNDTIREVELEGEAYFDVVKKTGQPFIVHTSGIDIKVLGTVFNVKSYCKEKTIEATLIRGSIEVVRHNAPKAPRVILGPHEKLVFQKENNVMATVKTANGTPVKPNINNRITGAPAISIAPLPVNVPDSALKETSWVYNKLIFDGDTFHELAGKMERWFNIKINFRNDKIACYRFRGAFENENIEQALQALQLTVPFNYSINNNEVSIYKK